jgi:DNA topoisomerase-1
MTILVLVESPAKCRKIESFLGPGYRVMASFGHIRDLPEKDMGLSFAHERVVVNYQLSERGREVVERLRREARQSSAVILATDLDREGEAIAWHLCEVLGPGTYQRATFNAITKAAVVSAIQAPRALDLNLVNAQQARRLLDRVVGYAVSPTCARGAGRKEARSAGRVQSVALRLVVERELEIQAFKPVSYVVPVATIEVAGKPPAFKAYLVEWKGEALGQRLSDTAMGQKVVDWCQRQRWQVVRAEVQRVTQNPPPPFITSTLQQAASVQLKLSPQESMRLAQGLYEEGAITYMRTDSTMVQPEAVAMARSHITAHFPREYLPERPAASRAVAANAQEAHEAIRPTTLDHGPDALGTGPQGQLYRLIWERFIASQMAPGIDERAVVDVACAPGGFEHPKRGRVHTGVFRARGTTEIFDGYRRLSEDAAIERAPKGARAGREQEVDAGDKAEKGDEGEDQALPESRLPKLVGDEPATARVLAVQQKTTKAPTRYSEASLIKLLERRGVGRPSTYAAIMATILQREYVSIRRRKLHASELGIALTAFLVRAYAGNFIEPDFTNRVESDLDRIASGERPWEPFLIQSARDVVALARRAGLWYDPLGSAPQR